MSEPLDKSGDAQLHHYYKWEPGIFQRAPWTALAALSLVVACALANIFVFVISNGRSADWAVDPNVIVGFLASFSITLLGATFSIGVTISWWRAAIKRRGTTLKELDRIWNFGPSGRKMAAWTSGRQFNKMAAVSILILIAAITYNALLQRAARYKYAYFESTVQRDLASVNKFQDGYVGNHTGSVVSSSFANVIQDYMTPDYYRTITNCSCEDFCTASIPSVGIHVTNSTSYSTIDLKAGTKSGEGVVIFSTEYNRMDTSGVPVLQMVFKFVNGVSDTCIANITTRTHYVQAGSVKYPLLLDKDMLKRNTSGSIENFVPVTYPGDSLTGPRYSSAGPIIGLELVASDYFNSSAMEYYNADLNKWTYSPLGTLALQLYDWGYDSSDCINVRFSDPSDAVISTFEDILFWASLDAAKKFHVQAESRDMYLTTAALIYVSIFRYVAAATLILAVAWLAVASTLWGWWELGRPVSLSPLETAKAFGAHLFQAENNDTGPKVLAENTGERRFKYGEQDVLGAYGHKMRVLRIGELGVGNDPVEPGRVSREFI